MDVVLNQAEENFKLPPIPDVERKERIVGGDALVQTFYEGPKSAIAALIGLSGSQRRCRKSLRRDMIKLQSRFQIKRS